MNKKIFLGLLVILSFAALFTACKMAEDLVPTYTVVFNANGGTGEPVSQTFNYGLSQRLSSINEIGFTHPDGYDFVGWAETPNGDVLYADKQIVTNLTETESTTLYARWGWIIKFDTGAGSIIPDKYVFPGGKVTRPTSPTRSGYNFIDWYAGPETDAPLYDWNTSINERKTLYAKWTAQQAGVTLCTVTYNSNGGGTPPPPRTVDYNTDIDLPGVESMVKAGLTFIGWNTDKGGGGTSYPSGYTYRVIADIELFAQWINAYAVTFNINGGLGDPPDVQLGQDGLRFVLPGQSGFAKTGYTFEGWCANENGSGTLLRSGINYTISGNITLYAIWEPNYYYIRYDKNADDADGTMSNTSCTYDYPVTLRQNNFTRSGYSFAGWNKQSDGSDPHTYENLESVTNLTSTPDATVTLHALWKANTYKVAYYANGGDGTMAPSVHTYGIEKNLDSNNFTLPGHSFSHWNARQDNTGIEYKNNAVVKNLTSTDNGTYYLYAQWIAGVSTITYNGNGGSPAETTVPSSYGSTVSLPGTGAVSRTGYIFEGWCLNKEGTGTVYTASYTVYGNVTLYAKWTAITYTVTYNGNDATTGTMSPQTFTYGASNNKLTANVFVRTGYKFLGWSTSNTAVTAAYTDAYTLKTDENLRDTSGTVTLFAVWSPITYNVTFDGNGFTSGSTSSPQTLTYDQENTLNKNGFVRIGYPTFAGWSLSPTATTATYGDQAKAVFNLTSTQGANITLYAVWIAEGIVVTFDTDGGTAVSPVTVPYGTTVTRPTAVPTKPGYIFDDWYTAPTGGSKFGFGSTVITSTTTIYARYTGVTYYVSFNGSNPTSGSMSNQTFTYATAKALTANAFVKTGYTFGGWAASSGSTTVAYTNSQSISTPTPTPSDGGTILLYAIWNPIQYTIRYNKNATDAAGTSPQTSSHTYDASKTLTTAATLGFSRANYAFAGWATTSGATSAAYANGESVINLSSTSGATVDLYAVWIANGMTVTFYDSNGTTVLSDYTQTVPYNTAISKPVTNPSKTGYTFSNWYTAATGGSVVSFPLTITANTSIYARWTAHTYTVNYYVNGGTGTSPQSSSHTYDTAKNLTTRSTLGFTRAGYAFEGWSTSSTAKSADYIDGDSVKNLTNVNGGSYNLYAVWTPNNYKVVFDKNTTDTVTGTMNNQSFKYDESQALSMNGFTRRGHNFLGWSKTQGATSIDSGLTNGATVSNLTTTTDDVKLYAVWQKVTGEAPGSNAQAKFTWLTSNALSSTAYTVTVSAGETLTAHNLTFSGYSSISITLKSSSSTVQTISFNSTGSLFTVGTGTTLALENITLRGSTANNTALVLVNSGGTFQMPSNTTVTQNTGGGVQVAGGTFTLSGGTVSSNTSSSSGAGVYAGSGSFTMSGGTISSNTTTGYGGGIGIASGVTVTMSGGTISSNKAANGGGVDVYGTFNMSGGTIGSSNNATGNGGGVHVRGTKFSMTGGSISSNTAAYGGGVYVTEYGAFTKTGTSAVISGNTATNSTQGYQAYHATSPIAKIRTDMVTINITMDTTKYGSAGGWDAPVVSGANLTAKLTWIKNNAFAGSEYIIEETATSQNLSPTTIDTGGIAITIRIKSSSNSGINLSSNGSLFTINNGVTLILDGANNKLVELYGYYGNTAPLVAINSGGKLILNSYSGIYNNTNTSSSAGAVYIYNGGTFELSGGTISRCGTSSNAGGIMVYGASAKFIMSSGSITNNSCTLNGGGVYIYAGTFTMTG